MSLQYKLLNQIAGYVIVLKNNQPNMTYSELTGHALDLFNVGLTKGLFIVENKNYEKEK